MPANDSTTTARREDVIVEKRRSVDRPDVAVVELRIAATDAPRLVRVVDDVPEVVPEADVGFAADHRNDWRYENGRVWFTAVVDGDLVETTYGVRGIDPARLAGPPRIDAVVDLEDAPATPVLGD